MNKNLNNNRNGEASLTGTNDKTSTISGLEALLKAQGTRDYPPVDDWNPSCCGDIGLTISADGTWYYRGSAITRPALVRLFASVLRRDEDGAHYLVTPVEKIAIEVADAPFLAVELEVSGHGRQQGLVFRTNVDDLVRCGTDHKLRFEIDGPTGGLKPYIGVRGRLEALVSRTLSFDLVELALDGDRNENGLMGVWSDGVFFPLPEQSDLDEHAVGSRTSMSGLK